MNQTLDKKERKMEVPYIGKDGREYYDVASLRQADMDHFMRTFVAENKMDVVKMGWYRMGEDYIEQKQGANS